MKREWWWGMGGALAGFAVTIVAGFVSGQPAREVSARERTEAKNEAMDRTTSGRHRAAARVVALPPGETGGETSNGSAAIRSELERMLAVGVEVNRFDVTRLINRWSAVDPEAALRFIEMAPRFPNRVDAMGTPLARIARGDQASAIGWVREHLPEDEQPKAIESMVDELSDAPALQLELGLEGGIVNTWRLQNPLCELAKQRGEEAVAWLERFPEEFRARMVDPLVGGWCANDPEAAMHWCVAQKSGPYGSIAAAALLEQAAMKDGGMVQRVIEALALTTEEIASMPLELYRCDPDAGLVLLPHLSEYKQREMLQRIVTEDMGLDPAGAIEMAAESSDPRMRGIALRALEGWQDSDFCAAQAWAEGTTDPRVRSLLDELQLRGQVERDPASYLAELDNRTPSNSETSCARIALCRLAERDPASAAAWMDAHTETAVDGMVDHVVSAWICRDEEAAMRWMQSLPSGEIRDNALSTVARRCAVTDAPESASVAIAAIDDPERRTACRAETMTLLAMNDEASALRWISSEPVSEEVRAVLVALVRSGNLPRPRYD